MGVQVVPHHDERTAELLVCGVQQPDVISFGEALVPVAAPFAVTVDIAEFHWRLGQSIGPDDLPEDGGLLDSHRGPYP
jgi:hypothetical protein